jgi:retron-type reverse transcriptase
MSLPEPGAYSFERLASFENLYLAACQARKGKRFTEPVARFHHDLAGNLVTLRDQLLSGAYRPGAYHTFEIWEPAHRYISAAPYRDRVVHHAVCNVIEPLFERSFIADSYANQVGKGTHRALDRCTEYARRYRYVFQGDVRKFFPSIDHEILFARLSRRIFDPRVLALARLILEHSNPQEPANFYFPGDDLFTPFERRRGLPIGNLTSQFWANVYLDPFDHYFRDELGVPGYIRYVDDFLVFADSKEQLAEWRQAGRARLDGLRLLLHETKSRIYPVTEGIAFLGFRVFPWKRRLLPASVKRARRRLTRLARWYAEGRTTMEAVRRSVNAWIAHASHGDTEGLRRGLLADAVFRASGPSGGARGVVEQQS